MEWFVGLLAFVVGFIVVGVSIAGAISGGLQRAANQIGGPVSVLIALLLFGITVTGLVAFVGRLSDRFRS